MIRIVYRWRVAEENRQAFFDAWSTTTQAIRENTEGARGSFCVASIDDPTEILTVARWDKFQQWQEFVGAAKSVAMKEMHALGTQISHSAFHEVGDYTV